MTNQKQTIVVVGGGDAGNSAHIVILNSGDIAKMTCKEAVSRAKRLAKIIMADIQGIKTKGHKSYPEVYCIGLGPTDVCFFLQKWGIDFVLTRKLGLKIRELTWNLPSLKD